MQRRRDLWLRPVQGYRSAKQSRNLLPLCAVIGVGLASRVLSVGFLFADGRALASSMWLPEERFSHQLDS